MEDEKPKNELGIFGLFIQKISLPGGKVAYISFGKNRNIPKEAIIMQLKALLNVEEGNYFDDFKNNFSAFGDD